MLFPISKKFGLAETAQEFRYRVPFAMTQVTAYFSTRTKNGI